MNQWQPFGSLAGTAFRDWLLAPATGYVQFVCFDHLVYRSAPTIWKTMILGVQGLAFCYLSESSVSLCLMMSLPVYYSRDLLLESGGYNLFQALSNGALYLSDRLF